jgi:hypothetical protein
MIWLKNHGQFREHSNPRLPRHCTGAKPIWGNLHARPAGVADESAGEETYHPDSIELDDNSV